MRIIATSLCLLILTVFALPVWADDFRCPNGNLVSTGQSISEVKLKCDPPSSKVRLSKRTIEWTYNQGQHKFVYYLVFNNGTLTEIRSGSFGR